MKKLFVGLLATLMMSAGLVALTGSTASAATCNLRYTACIATVVNNVKVNPKRKRGFRGGATVKFSVKTRGNATPRGSVTVTAVNKRGGYNQSRTLGYAGGIKTVKFSGMENGRYRFRIKFNGSGAFNDSQAVRHRNYTATRRR